MGDDRHLLYWKDQLVGVVTGVGWTNFPWAGGRITIGKLSGEVRAALEYVDRESKSDDGLQDWPFPEELMDHWRVVKPSGEAVEVSLPVVDFADGFVEWR